MKMIMMAMMGTLFMALLSGCGYNTMQANEETVTAAWGDVKSAYLQHKEPFKADEVAKVAPKVKFWS